MLKKLFCFVCFVFFFLKVPSFTYSVGCPRGESGNLNCDSVGVIDIFDLNILLSAWSPDSPAPTPPTGQRSADIVVDGHVNMSDLTKLLSSWGEGYVSGYPRAPGVNYFFYDWRNNNWDSIYPAGAPWGSIPVFAWKDLHTGPGQYNWGPVDNYLAVAATMGKPVILEVEPYESSKNMETIPSTYACDNSNQRPSSLYFDLTPDWLRSQLGGTTYIPLDGYGGRDLCVDSEYPNTCYAVAVMPKFLDPRYLAALKEFAYAFGARYNSDSRVGGVIFGWGIDAEFGEYTKGNWGDCCIKCAAQTLGFSEGQYLNTYVKSNSGSNNDNDYTDWFARAFPDKPVYHQVTSSGKNMVPVMMSQGYPNLGIKQASLLPDHNWFEDASDTGIMQLAKRWGGIRPVAWENAYAVFRDTEDKTQNQQVYTMMLGMLQTFPDFFDFVQNLCPSQPDFIDICTWARQYYGRTPKNTNDVWIAFQQTGYLPGDCGSMGCSGWMRDWEYGLNLTSTKGQTIWRQQFSNTANYPWVSGVGLKELFNQTVANKYSGQARKVNINETMVLEPAAEWKGLENETSSNTTLQITYVGNSGRVKVEVGSDSVGWFTQEWDKTNANPIDWQIQTLNPNKKPFKIKITPLSGEPLYMHMVKLSLR